VIALKLLKMELETVNEFVPLIDAILKGEVAL
jgi:hypothetical protein